MGERTLFTNPVQHMAAAGSPAAVVNLYDAFDSTMADAVAPTPIPLASCTPDAGGGLYDAWDVGGAGASSDAASAVPPAYSTFGADPGDSAATVEHVYCTLPHDSSAVDPRELARSSGSASGASGTSFEPFDSRLASATADASTDWLALLEAALALPAVDASQRVAKAIALHGLVRRFTACVGTLGAAVIGDVGLPAAARRLRPMAAAGGIAGGEKYLVGEGCVC